MYEENEQNKKIISHIVVNKHYFLPVPLGRASPYQTFQQRVLTLLLQSLCKFFSAFHESLEVQPKLRNDAQRINNAVQKPVVESSILKKQAYSFLSPEHKKIN